MTQTEIYTEIGKMVVQKAQIINQANVQVQQIEAKLNQLHILAEANDSTN